MKINWDKKCDFGGAFEKAHIEYKSVRGEKIYNHFINDNKLIYWWNRIYEANYEVVAIKNFDAKKLFKWAGVDDYPECLQGNLSHTREI